MKLTQRQKILRHLAKDQSTAGTLTKNFAESRLGVSRLAARINELREEGFTIYTNSRVRDGKHVTMYRMDNAERKAALKAAA